MYQYYLAFMTPLVELGELGVVLNTAPVQSLGILVYFKFFDENGEEMELKQAHSLPMQNLCELYFDYDDDEKQAKLSSNVKRLSEHFDDIGEIIIDRCKYDKIYDSAKTRTATEDEVKSILYNYREIVGSEVYAVADAY